MWNDYYQCITTWSRRKGKKAKIIACVFILAAHLLIWKSNVMKHFGANTSSDIPQRPYMQVTLNEALKGRVGIPADNAFLLRHLRKKALHPPSNLPYSLTDPDKKDWSEYNQTQILLELFDDKPGFFIEAGAADGERGSNTLYLESHFGWTGLLVEPMADSYKLLEQKHRKSWSINACLSILEYPHRVILARPLHKYITETSLHVVLYFDMSTIVGDDAGDSLANDGEQVQVAQCYPLKSMLTAIGRSSVDLLSLDVEGVEIPVLKTIPWKEIDIKVVMVEYNKMPGKNDDERLAYLTRFLRDVGYTFYASSVSDAVYYKNNSHIAHRITYNGRASL